MNECQDLEENVYSEGVFFFFLKREKMSTVELSGRFLGEELV